MIPVEIDSCWISYTSDATKREEFNKPFQFTTKGFVTNEKPRVKSVETALPIPTKPKTSETPTPGEMITEKLREVDPSLAATAYDGHCLD